jgi:hypothetical protein
MPASGWLPQSPSSASTIARLAWISSVQVADHIAAFESSFHSSRFAVWMSMGSNVEFSAALIAGRPKRSICMPMAGGGGTTFMPPVPPLPPPVLLLLLLLLGLRGGGLSVSSPHP